MHVIFRQPDVQAENENTPLTSDQLQIQKKIAKTPPIVCRKKNMKSIKKNKLPPKDLEFSKEKNKKRKLVPDEGKGKVKCCLQLGHSFSCLHYGNLVLTCMIVDRFLKILKYIFFKMVSRNHSQRRLKKLRRRYRNKRGWPIVR